MQHKSLAFLKPALSFVIVSLSVIVFTRVSLTQGVLNNRIRNRIDERSLSVVRGNLHPLARPQFDRGRLVSRTPIHRVTMAFKRTDAQQVDLDNFLQEQQDPSSQNYHLWLTPEEFG